MAISGLSVVVLLLYRLAYIVPTILSAFSNEAQSVNFKLVVEIHSATVAVQLPYLTREFFFFFFPSSLAL